MSLLKANKRVSVPELSFKRSTVSRFNGVVAKRVATAVFNPSANTGERTIGAHGLGVYIPDNAVITNVFIDVVTTFTSATDAATLAVHAQSANDIVAALAISNATNIWDAGIRGSKIGTYALDGNALTQIAMGAAVAGSMLKLTAERELTVTVAVEALTAGKLVVYVEYLLGE